MDEILSEVIIGAVVMHVFEDENENITAILFQKGDKTYKLFTPRKLKPYLIEQVDWI